MYDNKHDTGRQKSFQWHFYCKVGVFLWSVKKKDFVLLFIRARTEGKNIYVIQARNHII
jgi:hypothetical protein